MKVEIKIVSENKIKRKVFSIYKCESCGTLQHPGTPEIKVVTHIRKVIYPETKNKYGLKAPFGHETVKEIKVCEPCSNKKFDIVISGEEKHMSF